MSDNDGSVKGVAGLELVFAVLRKHEEALDKVTRRLEDLVEAVSITKGSGGRPKIEPQNLVVEKIGDWKEFRERAASAGQVLYDIGTSLSIKAVLPNGRLLKYSEPFLRPDPSIYSGTATIGDVKSAQQKQTLKLECGLEYAIRRTESLSAEGEYTQGILIILDQGRLKDWLQTELGVEELRISSGLVVI